MGNAALNAYIDNVDVIKKTVLFEGSTALVKGQGLCYNFDYGTAATAEPSRTVRCELPSITNARYFAGVVLNARAAKTGGQWVDIAVPGSTCYVLMLGPSVTPGSQLVTCQAGGTYAGYFTRAGFEGEGSAVPLQTIDAGSAATLCLAKLQTGLPSGLVEVVTPATAGGVQAFMVGGVSFVAASALDTANVTFEMADGTVLGLRKKFEIEGDLGDSYDLVITVNGIQSDGSDTALATLTGDDDGDIAVLEWVDDWKEIYVTGFAIG
jgi:hypothetical protein